MNRKKRNALALFAISMALFVMQAGIWWRTASRAHTETDKQSIEAHHPPNEIPGIAGTCLLIAAAVLASTPQRDITHRPRE